MESPPPSESNAFARSLGKGNVPNARLRFVVGLVLSIVLAACFTLAFAFLGGLIVRGVRHGHYWSLFAAVAVIAMTVVMARGRARK